MNSTINFSVMKIHGYDLNAVACSPSVPFQFFSGGDEKVIRVFESSQVVIDGLGKICVDASGVAIESSHRSKYYHSLCFLLVSNELI